MAYPSLSLSRFILSFCFNLIKAGDDVIILMWNSERKKGRKKDRKMVINKDKKKEIERERERER